MVILARLGAIALLLGILMPGAATAVSATRIIALEYLGQQIVPTGEVFRKTTVGGLSGIDYDAAGNRYLALSDDRSSFQPARFYQLTLDLDVFARAADPGHRGVTFTAVTTLRRADGSTFAEGSLDPESLRRDAARGQIYWSNEGRRARGDFQAPTVAAMAFDGGHVRDFPVPPHYRPDGDADGFSAGDRGVRDNLGFESLALSVDGQRLYAATESALAQDGDPASVDKGSRARILAFDVESGRVVAEYVYPLAPIVLPPQKVGDIAVNGLTEMVAIAEGEFIAIERSYTDGASTPGRPATGYSIRLFLVDIQGATNVSGLASISGIAITPVTKTLLLDLAELRNDDGSAVALANIEGITFGPLVDGQRTLILVGDNNFSRREFTQFIALALREQPSGSTTDPGHP